jgi:hypothetical protein
MDSVKLIIIAVMLALSSLSTASAAQTQYVEPDVLLLREIVMLRRMVTSQNNVITLQDQLISSYEEAIQELKAKCK